MSRIRSKDTGPEVRVRRLAHALGFRFRLHRRDLPGSPDLVFAARRKVIFVHGCYWHRHDGCRYSYMPKSNVDFWRLKFQENVARDAEVIEALAALRWTALVVWECETDDILRLSAKLTSFLNGINGYGGVWRE
jgi:DNA mismatch endonuclease (patch repair protein)